MGVRDRIHRVKQHLSRSSKSSSSSSTTTSSTSSTSLSKSSTASSTCPPPDPSIIYQPWEKMPTPKYRRPVAKEHADKLNAFDFATAWRRKSQVSLYSPMGSRVVSRRNSLSGRVQAIDGTIGEEGYLVVPPSTALTPSTNAPSRPASHHRTSSDQPFNAEDLSLALTRSHLDVPH